MLNHNLLYTFMIRFDHIKKNGEVLKKNQVNALLNNLKAKGIIDVNIDLFGFSMVSMTFEGVKFCKSLMRKKAAKVA